jgi:hypothetical protein
MRRFLGGRDLGTFNAFVLVDLSGTVVVHDQYVNYDEPGPPGSGRDRDRDRDRLNLPASRHPTPLQITPTQHAACLGFSLRS